MKTKNNEIKAKPIVFANVLKIMASFAVVMIHVSAIEWYKTDGNTPEWMAMNIYDSICRWSVPIFVMVTGMLLLPEEKEITIGKVFTKYIKKVVILLVFWSLCFSFLTIILEGKEITDLKVIFNNMIYGNYHLWYLYMLIGLYLITPFVKLITKSDNKKIVEYFCVLWFLFECFLGTFLGIQKESQIQLVVSYMHISFVLEYVGYYLLGYYLNTYPLNKIKRRILYAIRNNSNNSNYICYPIC